jgi:hypothetical protein
MGRPSAISGGIVKRNAATVVRMSIRGATLAAIIAALAFTPPPAVGAQGEGSLRMNELQVIGTHNSYHRELRGPEKDAFDRLLQLPGEYDRSLAYSHPAIPLQLEDQGVRGLELDLFPDPSGGLYREPGTRRAIGLGPLPDPAWRQPGIKAFHIVDLDQGTTCVLFSQCLVQIRAWSDANPRHVPLLVTLELKQSDERVVAAGGVRAPAWDAAQLDALDQEILGVFGPSDLVTPDVVRRKDLSLEESVRAHGWPSLAASRGRVVFLLDNEGELNDRYRAGRPSLEGRVLFTNGTPGQPDAAFVKRNDPLADAQEIRTLVAEGYLVRTRSDIPFEQATSGDTTMLRAAMASGAQLISTDFPSVGMAARHGSDYVARFGDGSHLRCNPVNAPAGCHDRKLEPASR